jgi:hypothetical protein
MKNQPTIPQDAFVAASEDDFHLPLFSALDDARAAGRAAFHLVLEPRTYRNVAITLRDRSHALAIHVLSRGPRPAVLQNCSLNVDGRTVHLRDLLIKDGLHTGGACVLQLAAEEEISAERLVLINNYSGEATRGGDTLFEEPVVKIQTFRPSENHPPAAFKDCWFLSNHTLGNGCLIATFDISHVAFEDCLLAQNAVAGELDPLGAREVVFERCLVYEAPLHPSWFPRPFIKAPVAFRHGLLALDTSRFQGSSQIIRNAFKHTVFEDTFISIAEPPDQVPVVLDNTRAIPLPTLPADLAEQATGDSRTGVQDIIAAMVGDA